MDAPMVEAHGVVKRYDEVTALKGADITIQKGEALALLGPNGAGKTTLVKILATLLDFDEGTVRVHGHDVKTEGPQVRARIGIVFQDASLDALLTGRENLLLHGRLYGMRGEHLRERITRILDLVGLEGRADHLVRTYSGGMRRRLEIGRGLLHEPDVLFLDEPTLGLDPHARIKVWDFIQDLKREGLTVLLTTHYMDEADELCERVAIIHHGEIIARGTPEELKGDVGPTLVRFQGELEDPLTIEGVVDVEPEPDPAGNTIIVVEAVDVVREIVAKATRVDHLEVRRPTLQDVFIHLTGDTLEGDEAGESTMQAAMRHMVQGGGN